MLKWKLKRKVVEKLRIVYKTGYIHEMWVYNLKVNADGIYTWIHYKQSNRIIDLQPENIISIFVVKRKNVFYWIKKRPPIKRKPKPSIVLDIFKPKTSVSFQESKFVPVKKIYDQVKIKEDIKIMMRKEEQKSTFGY